MASCQKTESTTSISEYLKAKITLFPNPTSGHLIFPFDIEKSRISVYNSNGQSIEPIFNGEILDLTKQPSGMYYIRIIDKDWSSFHKVMKL